MPIYEIETPDGRIMEIEGPNAPSLEIVKKAYAKLPPINYKEVARIVKKNIQSIMI